MSELKNIIIVLIFFFSASQFIFSQSGGANLCDISEPLCASNEFSYPNTFNAGNAEFGPDYGCLLSQPNPAWFYLFIDQSGDIVLQIEQSTVLGGSPDLDVDYIIYGPFSNSNSACNSELTGSSTIDCSYLPDFVEVVNVPNAVAGEYYILLITNFSDDPGFISVTQTSGTGATDCGILADEFACEGDIVTLDATTNFATNYIWYEDDGLGIGNFVVINGVSTATYDVVTSKKYKAEAYDTFNNLLETFEFNVLFFQRPIIPSLLQDYIICDNLDENDGVGQFDLGTKDTEILNGLNPNNFAVTYYDNITHANAGIEQLSSSYINSSPSEVIFIRIDNIITNEVECFDIGFFNAIVNLLPEFSLDEEYILCVSTNGTEEIPLSPTIDTDLNKMYYNFEWSLEGTVLPLEAGSDIVATQGGNYSVVATNISTGCSSLATTAVAVSSPPTVSASLISYAFVEDNVIQVTAIGSGEQEYEYNIDNGSWQDNDTFTDVQAGHHVVMARDKNGCGFSLFNIMVMDYLLFFTPNNDGYFDNWKIIGIDNQINAKIFIYDRYGKLLKQLSPTSIGWDGTFNGLKLPSSDYWFTVEFIEPKDGSLKQFNSHFTLKR